MLSRSLAVGACVLAMTLAIAACSPMTDSVPTLPPAPTETSIPTATPSPVPSATLVPSATPSPSATPVPPTSAPTSVPTPVLAAPVSKYFAPLAGQATGPAAVLALQRVEFWQEMTRIKPRNGLFVIFVGELRSLSSQVACAHADDFALVVGSRRYETSSSEMEPFKMLYKMNFPGSVLGQCVVRPETTFIVFDTSQQLGPARLSFRGGAADLGDLAATLRKSGYPLPGSENQLKLGLDKLLAPSPRVPSRLLDVKETDVSSPPGAKSVTVSWVIEDTGDVAKTKSVLKSEATALFRGVYTAPGLTAAAVEVDATLRTFDVFGNPRDAVVARLSLDAATSAKINWANFQADNILVVAKVIALDPSLKD